MTEPDTASLPPRPSYHHRGGQMPLLGATVDTYLHGVIQRHGTRQAVVCLAQETRLTYDELDDAVQELARGLLGLRIEHGDRVGVWSTDNVEWLLLQLATARIGAVLVNVNPAYRPAELRHALAHVGVRALFLIPSFKSSRYVEMVGELCPEAQHQDPDAFQCAALPELRRLVVWDPIDPLHTVRPARAFTTWQEVLATGRGVDDAAVAARAAALDPDDPINIQFTSGTTGKPKAVVLTHHGILNNAFFTAERLRLSAEDRVCVPVPFYHCFGMVVSNLGCLTHGATIVIPAPHFDAAATLAAIARERCTAVHGVPTMFTALLEHEDRARCDLSSLRTGIMAGAPCPVELMRRVRGELGCREILIGYGQTEASPVTHLTRPNDSLQRRVETVGTNLPHQEVKVVAPESNTVVPVGTPGEVCFRGYQVMRGYYGQPDATAKAIDQGGWLHSGDLGVMDEDGYLRITGRLVDMIIRGGENIYPAEVEAALLEHDAIADVAVVGVPDPRLGEEVVAWVVPHRGVALEPEDLRAWARERMAHYKVPRLVRVVDALPMTVTGKVQKFKLREWIGREQDAETAAPCVG